MSSSSDDLPLVQRPGFPINAKSRQVLSSDGDSPVPSWLKSPLAKVGQPIALTDSDSDIQEVASQPAKAPATVAAQAVAPAAPAPPSSNKKQQAQKAVQQSSQAAPSTAPKKLAGLLQAPSHTLPVMLPDRLSQLKVLVELESTEEVHGATDLSGDSGAIGRVSVAGAPGAQRLAIDLKGVLYSATIVPCPVTLAVVNIGAAEAKVECMLSEFIQLREDTRFTCGGGDGAVLDGLMGDDDGDDNYAFGGANDGEGGGVTKTGSRKRAAEAKGPAKPWKPAAAAAKKPKGGVKKAAAKRPRPKAGAKKGASTKNAGAKK